MRPLSPLVAGCLLRCSPVVATAPDRSAPPVHTPAGATTAKPEADPCLAGRRDTGARGSRSLIADLMIWREQAIPPRNVASLVPFDRLPSAVTVRAFAHRLDGTAVLDSEMGGCVDHVVSTDGRLCPSVIAPGVGLSASQLRRLQELTMRPAPRLRSRCDFDPHHSFVAFDRDGSVVAHLRVCFECSEWALNGDENVDPLPDGARSELAKLCRQLGLRGCPPSDDHPEGVKGSSRRAEPEPPERPSAALGIAPDTPLADLSESQKRQLCAWQVVEGPRAESGLEFDSGRGLRFLSYQECLARFPRCAEPLGRVEALDFSRFTIRPAPDNARMRCVEPWAFGPLGHCAWAIETYENGRQHE